MLALDIDSAARRLILAKWHMFVAAAFPPKYLDSPAV